MSATDIEPVVSLYVPLNKRSFQTAEAQLLAEAMELSRYNQSIAAKTLGISRGALRYKLKNYYGNKYVGGKL